ncbi:MAG: ATP synthase F1 subunit gamma [Candidatus Latescibacterota bacterium]|nr:MAG: ATP synthase F1 subunit gamma [Candidatus Latescibacterota bacterium]
MASLLDIKARLSAVENIKKITRAMQLVAAAKFKRAEDRAKTTRPYSEELDEVLGILAALAEAAEDEMSGDATYELSFTEGEAPLIVEGQKLFEQPDDPEPKRPGVVLFTADRGLCGAFNTKLIRTAQQFVNEHPAMECQLIPIGRKGYTYYKTKEIPIIHHEEGLSDKLELDEIRRIAHTLIDLYVSDRVDALYFIYAQFKSAMVSDVKIEKFLKIPRTEGETKEQDDYILEPERKAVYETLLPLYATTKVFATLADSFASEYGARMTAMQLATKNAEEMHNDLVILRNRLRQAVITRELAEIVGGAEALT